LEDGRTFVNIEAFDRFYIQEIIAEKPYIKARVQTFTDFTESNEYVLGRLEAQIFDEVRFNMKMMKILFPLKNYSLNANILLHRPPLPTPGVRSITTTDATVEAERRSKFSFAVVDMLQIPAATKLLLLQEHLIERRYAKLLKYLEQGGSYLSNEIRSRGVLTDEGIRQLRLSTLSDQRDLETGTSANSWYVQYSFTHS
jgi:hypothetical protein